MTETRTGIPCGIPMTERDSFGPCWAHSFVGPRWGHLFVGPWALLGPFISWAMGPFICRALLGPFIYLGPAGPIQVSILKQVIILCQTMNLFS